MKSFLTLSLAALLCCAMLASCGKKQATSRLDAIKAAGKIVVYTNPEFPPYEYLGANGQVAGAEIDLVNAIAAELGVKAEIVSAEFDSIIGTVITGKADMGASGFTITEERAQSVDFSIPFVRSVQYLIIAENSPIKTVEDLAGKKVGGQQGTTGLMMIENSIRDGLLKGSGAEAKAFNNAPDATVAMVSGQVDAVVIDELVAISLAKKNPGYKAIPMVKADGNGLEEPEEFGIIIAKGCPELLEVINKVIAECRLNGNMEAWKAEHDAKSAQ
ncbi:MAG: transporter substrate-binding domain-containing protein [Oligosphaeraceae bacterium]